jgi:hypothetical protein
MLNKMRKIILVMVLLFSIGGYAQRKNDGWSIQGHYGIMKGEGQISKFASTASVGVSHYPGSKGFLIEANLFVNDSYVDKDKFNLPYRLYGLNVIGGWSYENLQPVFINLKAGLIGGFEQVNNGNKTTNWNNLEGVPLQVDTDKFVYGAVISPEIELAIWRNLSGTVSFSQYWNLRSDVSEWKYSGNIGLKWYLN